MASDKHHHKRRIRPPATVELQYSKKTFDVSALLGKYAERAVDLQVHALADRAPQRDADAPPTSKPVSTKIVDAADSTT